MYGKGGSNVWNKIKSFFKRGGYSLTKPYLNTLNDHEKININPEELKRIERNVNEYQGKNSKVKYKNVYGDMVERDYMSMNLRKLTADVLSGLIFNEQCEIEIGTKEQPQKEANEFIQHVFEHNRFKKNLADYLEPMLALGGLAVRPYVNDDEEIEFSWAIANAFYPLRSNSNGISEGVMKSVTQLVEGESITYYTLLEFHEWNNDQYIISNELYKSKNENEIGQRVPLSDLYEDLEEETIIEHLTRPLFNYVKPSGYNNLSAHSPLGLGLVDNARSTVKKINDTYDQFWWEVRMGQRTVLVSDNMLRTVPNERGELPKQVFDPDVNVFKAMRMGMDQEVVKDVTSDIRTEQYTSAINQSLRTLEMELKLSVGTFSFDGRSVKTATEVVSENDMTFRTRNDHVYEVEQFIKGLIVSTLELAQAYDLFHGDIPTFEEIGVDFDDGVFQDRNALMNFYGKAATFKFMPTVEIIQRLWKVPEEVAKEWVEQIQEESMEPLQILEEQEFDLFGDDE